MKIIKTTNLSAEDEESSYYLKSWYDSLVNFRGGFPGSTDGFEEEIQDLILLVKKVGEMVLIEENMAREIRNEAKTTSEDNYQLEGIYEDTRSSLTFRKHTYKSLFLTSNSLLENKVIELCQIINNCQKGGENNLPDLKGYLKEYWAYLKRVLHESKNVDELFTTREFYQEIRNAIQHRGGKSKMMSLTPFIEETAGISYEKNPDQKSFNVSIIHSSFIIDYLLQIKTFLNQLTLEVSKV